MGNFSIWHWFIVLIVLVTPVVAGIALLIARSRRRGTDQRPIDARLAQLDALHARGAIDANEYARERARLLGQL